ncbi:hypothetical protein ACFQL4_21690 [Halosimplex aquaticum]
MQSRLSADEAVSRARWGQSPGPKGAAGRGTPERTTGSAGEQRRASDRGRGGPDANAGDESVIERRSRGVSTVVDVTFALLLVSASIGVLAITLTDDEPAHDPVQADRTAETLAAATKSVNYSVESVNGEPEFTNDGYDFERSTHGTLTGLLADAAVTNASFPDGGGSTAYAPDSSTYLTKVGDDFEVAVDGAVRQALTSAGGDAHVVAVWRPYRDSDIEGRVEAGAEPPPASTRARRR